MPIVIPLDVAPEATVAFVRAHVSPGAALLEVGCGEGHVAAALIARGHRVVAIDADAEAVASAVRRGVPASIARWPEVEVPATDAVVFSRSLHHINPLDAAVRKARTSLQAHGQMLVEDFAFDAATRCALPSRPSSAIAP